MPMNNKISILSSNTNNEDVTPQHWFTLHPAMTFIEAQPFFKWNSPQKREYAVFNQGH